MMVNLFTFTHLANIFVEVVYFVYSAHTVLSVLMSAHVYSELPLI